MQVVNNSEKIIYRYENSGKHPDTILITDKRFYYQKSMKDNTETCLSIDDIKMVKFTRKRARRYNAWWQVILKILIVFMFFATISTIVNDFTSSETAAYFIIPLTILIVITVLLIFTSVYYYTSMEIEYGSGSKVDIKLLVRSKQVMRKVRDAIFNTLDENKKTL